jgi:hypothetical protein
MSMPPQGGGQSPQQPPQSGWQPPQQPPPGWQQGPLAQQPGPPPQKGNSVKWLLVAIAVLLVIGVTIGATLLFTRGGGGGGPTPTTSGAPSDIASANDTGPVAIITDEPTCKTFNDINNSLADVQKNGWADQRGALGPASQWTPDQRSQVQAVVSATRNAADQMVALAKETPHRLVRELYEQFIAYGRAYSDSIPNYLPSDDALASANVAASSALFGICDAIEYGSAGRSLAVQPVAPPSKVATARNPADPQRFITTSNDSCTTWKQITDKFNAGTAAWQALDTGVPASQWTPDRRAMQTAALPFLTTWATDMEDTGRASGNPAFEDFAVAAALYMRAYLAAGDNYIGADSWLSYVTYRVSNLIRAACSAASG